MCMKVAPGHLVCVPQASATHPWWNDGHPPLSRFFGWARGDGCLISLYPKWAYLTIPNLSETLLIGAPVALVTAGLQKFDFINSALVPTVTLRGAATIAAALTAGDIAFELFLHLLWRTHEYPAVTGLNRVFSYFWACAVRNASEASKRQRFIH